MDHPIWFQLTRRKRTYLLVYFTFLADYKQSKKRDKYLELEKEMKKIRKLKVKVILIAIAPHWNSLEDLKKRLEEELKPSKPQHH